MLDHWQVLLLGAELANHLSGASTYNEWSSTKFLCYLSQLTTEEVGGEGGKVA